MLVDAFEAWRERTGHTILERYGMSETAMLTSNPYLVRDGERRGGTVGFPLPGVELRIRDDQGRAARQRRDRRHRGPRAERLLGLLAHAEAPGGIRRGRVVSHQRQDRQGRRARLRHDRRPQQGPDHQRRLQRLPGRGRGCAQRPAGRRTPRARWSACRMPTSARRWSRSSSRSPASPSRAIRWSATLKAKMANFKVPKALVRRRRAAAQRDGRGPGESAARALREPVRLRPRARLRHGARQTRRRPVSGASGTSSPPPPRPGPCDRRSA